MGVSDRIEAFILELLKDDEDFIEIGRNELASVFNCVPSQINYVISTRFTSDKGYLVESRRGGGGCLRIKRVQYDSSDVLYNAILKTGKQIDFTKAKAILDALLSTNAIDEKSYSLILNALSEKSIPQGINQADEIRANILKNMLITLM